MAGVPGVPGHRDGELSVALLHAPAGIVAASSDALVVYVADTANHVLRVLTPASLSTLAGAPRTPGYADGPLSSAAFSSPSGLAVMSDGRLLVADTHNNCVRRLCFSARRVSTVAGKGGPKVWGAVDGPAREARLNLPRGVAAGRAGEVWIADSGNNAVRVLHPTDGAAWASPSVQPSSRDGRRIPEEAAADVLLAADSGNRSPAGFGNRRPSSADVAAGSPGRDRWLAGGVAPPRSDSACRHRHAASTAPTQWHGLSSPPREGYSQAGSPGAVSQRRAVAAARTTVAPPRSHRPSEPGFGSSPRAWRDGSPLDGAAGIPQPYSPGGVPAALASPSFERAGRRGSWDGSASRAVQGVCADGEWHGGGRREASGGKAAPEAGYGVQLFERPQHSPAGAEGGDAFTRPAWAYVGAAEVWVGPALLAPGHTTLPRFGVPPVAELLVRPLTGAPRRALVASVGQISVRDSVFVCCEPPPPASAAAAALARATGRRSEMQVGLRFRSADSAAAFLARCREVLTLNLPPPAPGLPRRAKPASEACGGAGASVPTPADDPPHSSTGLDAMGAGRGGAELNGSPREVLLLTSQLADREGQIARLSQQLAALSRDHRRQMAELRRQMDEERAYWRSHAAELAAQAAGKAHAPPMAGVPQPQRGADRADANVAEKGTDGVF